MPEASPMSNEFHDWLDECPVQWHRVAVDKANRAATYEFIEGDDDEQSD